MVFDQERVVEAVPLNLGRNNGGNVEFRYRECTKNHALSINGYAIDGCGEFMPAGEEGTLEGILCAACNCHRNFHRSEAIVPNQVLYYHYYRPAGYQHQEVTLAQAVQPQTLSAASDPSSSGGSIRKRHRTRFTQGQKDQMLEFAKALGWRIQKGKEETVEQFCAQLGIRKQVLKVWMHNNKHTLGKQP